MQVPAFKIRLAATSALLALVVAAGCSTNRPDSVVVGAVPDDYRTNHPIMIGEKARKLDLPVGQADRGMTEMQRSALAGFLQNYDYEAQPPVTLIVPVGSANEISASNVSQEMIRMMTRMGVQAHRIATAAYRASGNETAAPVRVTYMAMQAYTNKCGRWPADIGSTTDNKHYANFGCSMQNNLAAQIANPADLLGPRAQSPIDAENRGRAISSYKQKAVPFEQTIDYSAN